MRFRVHPIATAILFASAAFAAGESRVERTLKLDPGGRFRLDADVGAVTITGRNGSGAHVVFTSSRADLEERIRFQFDEGPGSATVTARYRRRSIWFEGWRGRVDVTIEVPFQTAVDIRTSGGSITLSSTKLPAKLRSSGGRLTVNDLSADLDADTSGGSIEVRDVGGTARVRTSGGRIEASRIRGSLDAETSGGSVRIENVGGDVKAHSSGGPIRIADGAGRVDADTSGGSVDVAFAKGNGRGGHIESSGGGIVVSLDPSVKLEIDAHGERVESDLPLTTHRGFSRESLSGALNGGGPILRLETSGGSVRIRSL